MLNLERKLPEFITQSSQKYTEFYFKNTNE